MISCPKCGKENQDHYKFCLGCGNELPREGTGAGGGGRPFVPTPPSGVPAPSAAAPGPRAAAPAGPPPGPPVVASFGPPGPAPVASAATPRIAATCPQCSSPNPRGNRFCLTCGADLTTAAAPPSVPVPNLAPPGPVPMAPAPAPMAPPMAAPAATVLAPPATAASGVASRARFVLIKPDGAEGGTFQLNEGVTVVGRETGGIFAGDSYLGPRHATITVNGATASVRDENALNGVYLRVERQAPTEIRDTDVFRIGQEILRYDAFKPVTAESDGTERQGAQIEGLVGRISLVVGRDVIGNAFPVPVTGLFLGRERGDILFPEDGYVSGLHCQLTVEGGKLMLTDVGSSNGTYVRLRGERTIRNNDLLLMGQQLFRLTM